MKLAPIPPGKFLMGSPDNETGRNASEGPQHEVVLTGPFYMGVHDVTVGQFKAFVKETGYQTEKGGGAYRFADGSWQLDPLANWQNPGFEQSDDHPVVCVSWNDANAFCNWLSKKEKRMYQLPTEAQWEYACRAGTTTAYSFGDDPKDLGDYAWYQDNSGNHTHPVGGKKPNPWGLYDMHGNVWQGWPTASGSTRKPPLKNLLKILKVRITEAVSFAAVRGATNRGSAARPTATASIPASASLSAASGSCCVFPPGLRNYL